MKKTAAALFLTSFLAVAPSHAIDFWHSSTVWAGQGQCSAIFTFDSGSEYIKNLQVAFSAKNKSGRQVTSGILKIETFGESSADRYSDAFFEDERICDENLIIHVTKASAIIDGQKKDLLKQKMISAREFKPFKIQIQK